MSSPDSSRPEAGKAVRGSKLVGVRVAPSKSAGPRKVRGVAEPSAIKAPSIAYRVGPYLGLSEEEIERAAAIATRRIRNPHDREDACQEFRIAAWQALQQAEPERDPRSYQRKSGRHAVIDFVRKRRRHLRTLSLDAPLGGSFGAKGAEGSGPVSLAAAIASRHPGPAEVLLRRDLVERIFDLVESLPTRLRRVAHLALEGRSTPEMAKMLRISRQAVNRNRRLALETLAAQLHLSA